MAYDDLREFIKALDQAGELKRISIEVDPILEIAEITDRVSKLGGPALLFENAKGSNIPVLINSLGSQRRVEIALGVESVDDVAQRIQELVHLKPPEGLFEKLKMIPRLAEIGSFIPKTVKNGPVHEVVEERNFSLFDLPILQCWPGDAGHYITFGTVFSHHPESGKRNCGLYRMQVYDERTTGMHWQIHKHGAEHFRRATKLNKSGRMEVAVAIGTDPSVTFSAMAPLPPDLDEMLFAGFLRCKPVEMIRCRTVDIEVPATAEIVLEGYVDLSELRTEGPFGDHTGYYSLPDEYPVFHVTCVCRRRDPIYLTTIVGPPPMEDYFMGNAVERIFLPLMKLQMPEIMDMHMPAEGIFHNLMIVAIRKSYPGQARKVMNAIWSLGQAMFTKCIVVVDDDVNVRDLREVTWKALNHIDPERDIQFTLGPVDSLDHSSRLPNYGSKMGIDATTKGPSEGFYRPWPDEIKMDAKTKAQVDAKWDLLGI
ncbi:MAG: menaquinone biosynthesis decarboxylase [Acidobacteria bacterium RIFCSPLOWO2_12_FULL_54_10]|nr:MAG: menaquinone biosynthesis decarboxylase [Acidobacteria bacterium RIFCSPLOWO2_12_FULL_54_10]